MKYGIISTAKIISRFINAVNKSDDEVYAVASRDLSKALNVKNTFDIPKAYGSYEELYQDEQVEVVYIALNNANHYREIMKALEYGKHVVCEKPMCLTSEEVKQCFAYAKSKRLFLMEAQKSVFLPITMHLKEIIESKELGELRLVEMSSSFDSPEADWMHDHKQGGVVYGSASYTIEYLDYLIELKNYKIQSLIHQEDNKTADVVSMNIKMDDVIINSKICMGFRTKDVACFYFENGYVEIENFWKARSLTMVCEDEEIDIDYPQDHEMVYEVMHIHDCIKQGLLQSPIMNEARTLMCAKIVEEILQENPAI